VKSVLVTNTGDTAHAAQLAARHDLRVVFVTEPRFVDQYPDGTEFALVDSLNDPAAAVGSVVRQRDLSAFTHVVSLSERAAPVAGYLRSYLGLPGTPFDVMTNCTNKYAMKRALKRAEIRTARFMLAGSAEHVSSAAEQLGWPVIIKPVIGAGVDATFVIHDAEDLASETVQTNLRLLAAPRTTSEKNFPVVVEQYLPVVEELHCDGYVRDGVIEFARVSRYLRPVFQYTNGVFGSQLLPDSEPVAKEVRAMHDRSVRAVGLADGVTHFEALRTERGLFAGEIACRPGGGGIRRMLQLASGFDTWDAHIRTALGEGYRPELPTPTTGESILQLMLPSPRGTIRAISDARDFEDIPGLIEATIKYRPGEKIDGLIDSSSVSGYVFVRLSATDVPADTVHAVEQAFRLDVA
jgi:biotin carboxylase